MAGAGLWLTFVLIFVCVGMQTRRPHVVVAGPTSCILAVSLAKAGAMVTIVEDLQLLTVK